MSGHSSSPILGHSSDMEDNGGGDEYNTLPETPAPFSPTPLVLNRGRSRAAAAVASSSPQLGFSDLPSQLDGQSRLSVGGMAGYTDALSSQMGSMSMGMDGARARRPRGELGFGSQALSSELGLGSQADVGAKAVEIRTIWGTIVQVRDVMATFKDFLQHFTAAHRAPAEHALSDAELHEPVYPGLIRRMHEAEIMQLNVDAQNLLAYAPARGLYRQVVSYPQEVLPIMDYVLTELYLEQHADANLEEAASEPKVRVYNLSASTNMRELNPGDMDKLVSVRGMLVRASAVIPDMQRAFYRCTQCEWATTVGLDKGVIDAPAQCSNSACLKKDAIELVPGRSTYADKQLARLQETPEVIPDGQTPHTVTLVAHGELVDVARPGDRLEITGIYRGEPVRVNPRQRTVQALYRTYIDVVHVRRLGRARTQGVEGLDVAAAVEDAQRDADADTGADAEFGEHEEAEFRRWARDARLLDMLARSVAPGIHGLDDVKRGLLLQLFGGVRKQFDRAGAPRARGDINVLLVGDPGVSKSQLLSAVHALAPRGIYTSGKGSSAVGLTAYITRDPDTRQLVLESGALVLSDDGICCIDEFDKMTDSTRSVLHEAMEQQTISIAKAGIITSLNARCSILAAANPVDSKWNARMSIVDNINLPPTLVSRFDLVFIVLDSIDEAQDRRLARHIVSLYADDESADDPDALPRVPASKLTRYIAYARRAIRPRITDDAADALTQAYVALRRIGRDANAGRVTATARQLESMIRMSEAHAKMRLSETVEPLDVEMAAQLMRDALREAATDPRTGLIDLDLLNTGFAASDRRQLDALKSETRALLVRPDAQSAPYQVWLDRLSDQSYAPIPPRLFDQVVRELQTEGVISIVGSGRNMQIVVKQSAISG
ncbi:MCM DNA helicase complex subunit [Coemansia sp. RSA 2618]|nr:MCM DNA helicase complex subunit [Coemansia sp. RSA 2618]